MAAPAVLAIAAYLTVWPVQVTCGACAIDNEENSSGILAISVANLRQSGESAAISILPLTQRFNQARGEITKTLEQRGSSPQRNTYTVAYLPLINCRETLSMKPSSWRD